MRTQAARRVCRLTSERPDSESICECEPWSETADVDAPPPTLHELVTEVELVVSCRCSGGSDSQAGLGEAAVDEVAAVLDVS